MLLHQFNRLSQGSQYQYLLLEGACVSDRITDTEDRLLFQLTNFYVEVLFERNTDHLLSMHLFTETSLLDPYLEEIDITGLIS